MLLYTEHNTNRLQYIVEFFSSELFDEPIRITTDQQAFQQSSEPRINYSNTEFSEKEFFIRKTHLLFEPGIREQVTDCFELNYHKAFFQTSGDFSFDIFAASFYLISRYEEYLPHKEDAYGRYAHENSLAFREDFLKWPLVNIWLQEFKKALSKKFAGINFRYGSFKFIPTYDIDSAYSYLHKGWKRNLGGLLKSIREGKWSAVNNRIGVLMRKRKDPFDTYEWLDSLHLYARTNACYFFLVAASQKGYDKNISPRKKALQDLIRYHAKGYKVGIHPSWQSGDQEQLLKEELEWLEYQADKKIIYSRQHYIRMKIPETYRRLEEVGIESDFSMGYGSCNGFRASVASSFYWYDLEKEEKTRFRVFPFCFMDANSFYENKFSAKQAWEELMHYYYAIRKVNGLMITIWHNHFLGTAPEFAGWKELYETFIREEVYWDN